MAELRAVFGEVKRIYCTETRSPSFTRTDIEGTMTCLLEMESGFPVQLVQSCETGYSPERLGTTVFGTQGTLFSGKNGISVYSRGDGETEQHALPANRLSDYAREFEAFAEWIEQGFEPPTTGISERGSLAVIQAGYESAKSGLPINIEQRFGKT